LNFAEFHDLARIVFGLKRTKQGRNWLVQNCDSDNLYFVNIQTFIHFKQLF